MIDYVYPDSPAAAAGLTAGDVVLKIGDTPVPNLAAFQTVNISSLPVGSNLEVMVLRARKQQAVDVVLGRRPDNEKSDDFNDESIPRWNQVKQFILPGQLTMLRVSDSYIGCAAYQGPVTFWDPSQPSDSTPVAEVNVATRSMGTGFVDLSEDGTTAVVAGSYGDAAIYNVAAGRKKFSLCDPGDHEIVGCRIDRIGKQAVTLDTKSNLRVWDAETGKEIYTENVRDAYVAEFDPHKPRIWSFRHSLREFEIPPLAGVSWSIVRAKEDAVDFSLSLRDSNLSVASSVTSDISGVQKTFRYIFSDGSCVSGATDPSGEPVDYVFVGADGVPLDGQLGVVLTPDGVVTEVAPGGAAAAAGLRPRQKLLGTAEQEAGPFYRLPPSGDTQAAFVRLRACRGSVGSSVWLRIQDESGKVATVECERRKMP